MTRTVSSMAVALVVLATAGCCMCCRPYDHCGPVYQGCGGCSCRSQPRAGSILDGSVASGTVMTGSTSTGAPHPARVPSQGEAPSQPKLGLVPGSERIVSVTDRVVDPSATSAGSSSMAGQPKLGIVPGSERIVSVTDRVVDPSASSTGSSSVMADSSADAPRLLPSNGWTARRATPDVLR
jgi:hypothetical protein